MKTLSDKNPDALYTHAAPIILDSIVEVCKQNGRCVLGIVGGRSVPGILENILANSKALAGHELHIVYLDERVDGEKNHVQAEPFFERLKAAGVRITSYPLKSTDHEEIKQEARAVLDSLSKITGQGPRIDVAILSAGEDGHICGLFPGQETLGVQLSGYVVIHNAPKPPPVRITITPPLLLTAREAFLFFVGDKCEAYDAFSVGGPPDEWPVRLVREVPAVTVFTSLQN